MLPLTLPPWERKILSTISLIDARPVRLRTAIKALQHPLRLPSTYDSREPGPVVYFGVDRRAVGIIKPLSSGVAATKVGEGACADFLEAHWRIFRVFWNKAAICSISTIVVVYKTSVGVKK
jgi:hypothetical protein